MQTATTGWRSTPRRGQACQLRRRWHWATQRCARAWRRRAEAPQTLWGGGEGACASQSLLKARAPWLTFQSLGAI